MQIRAAFPVLAASFALAVVPPLPAQSSCQVPQSRPQTWEVGRAVVFQTAGLAVDADGAPNSYLADGKGLSETCDGVVAVVNGKRVTKKTDPKHWYAICKKAWADAQANGDYTHVAIFGFLADKSGPILQKEGDPLPGKAYVTTTTLSIPGTPINTQRHWVDASSIPYVVLSPSFRSTYHVKPGDLTIVYRPNTSSVAYGIFADGGDLGEASIKLHLDLGNDPISTAHGVARANRGIDDRVLTLVFPGTNIPASLDSKAWNAAIQQTGHTTLETWGGLARLRTCAQQSAGHVTK
jgi:hypothetical protein